MIKVNLLPAEYRRVERTPVFRFVTILCGVVLSASAIGAFLYVHFGTLENVIDDRETLAMTEDILRKDAQRSKALDAEAREYQKRRATIDEIARRRLLWSKKLDELCDLIHNKGDSKRHLVWLSKIGTIAPSKTSAGGLSIKGLSGGEELHRLSDFHLDIRQSEYFQDFQSIDDPEGEAISLSDERVPKTAWQFDFNMHLKPFGWNEKAAR